MSEEFDPSSIKLVKRKNGAINEMLPTGEKDSKGWDIYLGVEREEFVQFDAEGKEVTVTGFPSKAVSEVMLSAEIQAQLKAERDALAAEINEETKPREAIFEAIAAEKAREMLDAPVPPEASEPSKETQEEFREEVAEDMGEVAVAVATEALAESVEPEVLSEEEKGELIHAIELGRQDLEYRLNSYEGQRGYKDASHGGESVVEKVSSALNRLVSEGEPRSNEDRERVSRELQLLARQLDDNIVGASEPFVTSHWEDMKHDYFVKRKSGEDLAPVAEYLDKLTNEIEKARGASHENKNMAANISTRIKNDLIQAITKGWPVGDQLYDTFKQIQTMLGQDTAASKTVAELQSTVKHGPNLSA